MKILFSPAARRARTSGAIGGTSAGAGALAGVVMLGLLLQGSQVQAQPAAPAPNANDNRSYVYVGDQIVLSGAVIRGKTRDDVSPLSLAPSARKWPQGRVFYTYDPNMSAAKQALFESGCREWEKHAGLHFAPRTTQANYIVVTSTANASNSFVGMMGGAQVLNLADWANKITVVHELAHALGIIHEQSRPDRDTYVTIHPENIVDGQAHNFDKVAGALNQGPYDFDSMMHYHGTAFSKNGQQTITANAGFTQFQNRMGQRNDLSDGDKKGMALVYGAPGPNGRGIIKPLYPKTNDTLTATLPEENPEEKYVYAWSKNGVRIAGETSKTLDLSKAGNGDKGDEISVLIGREVDKFGTTSLEILDEAAISVLNSAPVVTPQKSAANPNVPVTANDKPYQGQFTGSDDDNDSLTFLVVTKPENGTLKVNEDGSYVYTPDAGFVGTDGFKIAANDGQTSSLPETFSIKVEKPNNPPVFEDTSLRLTKDVSVDTRLGATDPDGDALTYRVTDGSLPEGVFLFGSGRLIGRPTQLGTTNATVVVTDQRGNRATAVLTIEVKIDDRPPTVAAKFAPASPKTNDVLTVIANVRNQTLGGVSVIYRFSVNGKRIQSGRSNTLDLSGYNRGDKGDVIECQVTATNEGGGVGSATVKTTVINSAPVTRQGKDNAFSGVLTSFKVAGFDADDDEMRINIMVQPENGRALAGKDEDGKLQLFYRSNPGFTGVDKIRFTVSDGKAESAPLSTFVVLVREDPSDTNRAPSAKDIKVDAFVGQPLMIDLPVEDPDGDPLRVRIVKDALYGNAAIRRGKDGKFELLYSGPNRASANDRVTYIVTDSKGKKSNEATVTINFVNRAPNADSSNLSAISGEAISQVLTGIDPDRDEISFRLVDAPKNGVADIKRDEKGVWRVTYKSNEDYVGSDSLTFITVDAAGKKSDLATVSIDVVKGNRAPIVLTSGGFTVNTGQEIFANLEGEDPDGDEFTFRLVGGPAHGEAEIAPDPAGLASVRYKSEADYVGPDSVTIIAVDSLGRESAPTTLTIDVVKAGESKSIGSVIQSGPAPSGGKS